MDLKISNFEMTDNVRKRLETWLQEEQNDYKGFADKSFLIRFLDKTRNSQQLSPSNQSHSNDAQLLMGECKKSPGDQTSAFNEDVLSVSKGNFLKFRTFYKNFFLQF